MEREEDVISDYWSNKLYTFWMVSGQSASNHKKAKKEIDTVLRQLDKNKDRLIRNFDEAFWDWKEPDVSIGDIMYQLMKKPWKLTADIEIEGDWKRKEGLLDRLKTKRGVHKYWMPEEEQEDEKNAPRWGPSFKTLRLFNTLLSKSSNKFVFYGHLTENMVFEKDIALLLIKKDSKIIMIKHKDTSDIIPHLKGKFSLPYVFIKKLSDAKPSSNDNKSKYEKAHREIHRYVGRSAVFDDLPLFIPAFEPGMFTKIVFELDDVNLDVLDKQIDNKIKSKLEAEESIFVEKTFEEWWEMMKDPKKFHVSSVFALAKLHHKSNQNDQAVTDVLEGYDVLYIHNVNEANKHFQFPAPDYAQLDANSKNYSDWRSKDRLVKYVHLPTLRKVLRGSDITNSQILDIGCGDGYICSELFKMAKRVLGIDISKKFLTIARNRKIENCEFIEGDARQLDKKYRNQFDIVTAIGVLFYFKANDVPRIIKNAYNALKPGGKFVALIVTPDLKCPVKKTLDRRIRKKSGLDGKLKNGEEYEITIFKEGSSDEQTEHPATNHSMENYKRWFEDVGFIDFNTDKPKIKSDKVASSVIEEFNNNPYCVIISGKKDSKTVITRRSDKRDRDI